MATQALHNTQNETAADYNDRIRRTLHDRLQVEGGLFVDGLFPHAPGEATSISVARDYAGTWQTQIFRDVSLETAENVDSGVIMVANADWDTVTALGAAYRIAPISFFHHAKRMRSRLQNINRLEEARAPCHGCWHVDCQPGGQFRAVDFEAVDCQLAPQDTIYRASIENSDDTNHMRMSFIQLKHDLYLVLIDGDNPGRFWFKGMALPDTSYEVLFRAAIALKQPQFSFKELVLSFFTYPSNRGMLHRISKVVHGDRTPGTLAAATPEAKRVALGALCWLFSLAALKTTVDVVETQVTALSYKAIDEPSMETLQTLSNCRKGVQLLRDLITSRDRSSSSSARSWAEQTFEEIEQKPGFVTKSNGVYNLSPESQLKYFKEARMDSLTKSLDGSFQLLIGAITVTDSDANNKQAERATLLTLMAAIYLPLSLATSVFGMNIKELSDSTPWWAVAVAIAVILCPTAAFLFYLFTKGRIKRWRQSHKRGGGEVFYLETIV